MTAIFIPPVIDNLTTASGTSSLSANQGVVLEGQIAAKAADASVVHIAGTETVTGAKTFSALVKVLQSSIAGTFDAGGLQYRNSADPTRVLNFGIDTSIGTYGYAWVQAVKSGTATMPFVLQPGGGNVGLGTSSPGATLDVRTNSTYPLTWGSTSAQIGALVYAGTTAHITGLVGDISLRPSSTEVLHLSSASSGQAALISAPTAATKGLTVQGAASQSANLQEWQNSTGTALASIAANGDTTLTGMMTLNGVTGRNVQFIPDYSVSIQALQFDGRDAQINQFLFRNTAAGLYAAMSADSSGGFSWETASSLPLVFRPNGVGVLQLQASSQSALLTAAAATVKALVVKGAASQTANLQEWQNSSGNVLLSVNPAGSFVSIPGRFEFGFWAGNGVGFQFRDTLNNDSLDYDQTRFRFNSNGFSLTSRGSGNDGLTFDSDAIIRILSTSNSRQALIVKGIASQSANLQEWQDSGGSVLALVDANGRIGSGVTPTAQLHVQSRAPGYTAFIAHAAGSSIAEFWNNNVKQLTIAPSGALSWGSTGVGYAALYMDASYVVDGAGSVTSGFGQLMRPTIRPNTGSNAFAIYTQPTVDTSVGTVANVYGLYTDAPAVTGANTVTNAYGAYFKTPTIGSTKNVGFVIETTSTADNAAEVRDSGGTLLSAIDKLGAWRPPSLTDSAAANGTLYYSTTASKLVYKDAGGTVNALY